MSYVTKVNASGGNNIIASSAFGICDTLEAQTVKEVVVPGFDKLVHGATIHVLFSNSNTASNPQLRVSPNGTQWLTTCQIIIASNKVPGDTPRTSWNAGAIISFTYIQDNGTGLWVMNDWSSDTIYTDATSGVSGLMPGTDKTKLNAMSEHTDILVRGPYTVTTWTSDNTYADYPYKAVISVTGATATMVPSVVFSPEDIAEYNFAPVALAGDGTVTIYAEVQPASVTVPTIVLVHGRDADS